MKQLYIKACICFIALQSIVTPQEKALSPKESFFLKRVTEFWKDKDYALVKKQINEHLAENPECSVADNLYAILGDISFQEENYADALAAYDAIKGIEFKEKMLHRHVICMYELKDFDGIIDIAAPFFAEGAIPKTESKEEVQFLLAESLFKKVTASENGAEQEEFARLAKPLYQSFSADSYKELSLFPLAEIHRVLNEYPQACSLYEILAEKHKDKAEELLFQSATLKLAFDKKAAIETYGKVYQLNGKKASDASYNQFVLLFQAERYADLISLEKAIAEHLPEAKTPIFHFCLGRSHYNLGQFDKAAPYLEEYLMKESDNSAQKKSAFLTLISCAQETNDSALFDRTLEQLITAYPNDQESAKALLLHAQTALQKDNVVQAASDLNRVISSFPDFEQRENILYDHALLLSQSKNWAESRQSFLMFLQQFPKSSHGDLIWSYILNCSVQELKMAVAENMQKKKEQFASDLKTCLVREHVFTPEERSAYQFLLGKTLYELANYNDAVLELEAYTATYPNHPSLADGYLMLALSYRELGSQPEQFIENAEKALAINPQLQDHGLLHLQLFNTYLSLHQFEKAADHLFEGHIVDGMAIQNENQLWLANYYYGQSKSGNHAVATERATLLFKKILHIEDDEMHLQIPPESSFLEVEALKLAELLPMQKKNILLSALTQLQSKNPGASWRFHRQALFELGKSYEALNETDQALNVYNTLIHTSSHASSYFSFAAELERDRLLYSHCRDEERNEANPQIIQILSSLKDLQIQKKLLSEPIHLEAALAYADIRTSLATPEARIESAIFFLNRIKEDFTLQDDILSQEYHEARQRQPEKDALYQNYMKCIEAEMLRLEAIVAKNENRLDKAQESEAVAVALFEEVLRDSVTTPYLRSRVEINLKAIRK